MNILGTATTNFTTKADLAGTLVPPILHRRRLVRIFTSEDALRIAAKEYDANPTGAIETYGPIADWNVSAITDMSELFSDRRNFNADISNWDIPQHSALVSHGAGAGVPSFQPRSMSDLCNVLYRPTQCLLFRLYSLL